MLNKFRDEPRLMVNNIVNATQSSSNEWFRKFLFTEEGGGGFMMK